MRKDHKWVNRNGYMRKDFDGVLRYMVFGIEQYYPSGGVDDCDVSFDTLEEARAYCSGEGRPEYTLADYIFDRIEGKVLPTYE